jgi:hypothetical protein
MNKSLILPLSALLALTPGFAGTEVGAGCSLTQSGTGPRTIFVPIVVSNLMIEGSLAVQHLSQNAGTGDARTEDYFYPGVGVFALRPLGAEARLYLGGRLTYINAQGKQTLDTGYGLQTYAFHETGFSIAPTIGIEYFPIKHLSIGGEVSYVISKTDTTNSQTQMVNQDSSFNGSGTQTQIILRWYF